MASAQYFLDSFWDGRLPVDPASIAQNAGITVLLDDSLAHDGLSGRFAKENGVPVIRCNPYDHPVRQRFTIAHELGHCALGHGAAYRDPATNFSANALNPEEVAANRFAAQLLMPADLIELKIKEQTPPTLNGLANLFGVSEIAMKYRLINLGWLRG